MLQPAFKRARTVAVEKVRQRSRADGVHMPLLVCMHHPGLEPGAQCLVCPAPHHALTRGHGMALEAGVFVPADSSLPLSGLPTLSLASSCIATPSGVSFAAASAAQACVFGDCLVGVAGVDFAGVRDAGLFSRA